MYQSFFGLRERPFELTPNPRFVVLTDSHREALSNLEYGIASRRGITLLIGDAGTGKTTLIRTALQRQPDVVRSVYLHNPALTRAEFVELLAVRFQLSTEARTSKACLLNELEAVLRDRHQRGESTVLIVDEAQSLPLELLEEIRLLGNIETDETKLMSIVLAGQPELAAKLNLNPLRQLKQRIALRCELRPLTASESAGYLAGRIRAAGGVGAQVFTREAVLTMHEYARGIPRTLSVIADNALLSAFALGQKPVNSQVVSEVCRDFDLRSLDESGVDSGSVESGKTDTAEPPRALPQAAELAAAALAAKRVLSFEPGAQPIAPAQEATAVADAPVAPPAIAPKPSSSAKVIVAPTERESERKLPTETPIAPGGMFTSVYPKRRRFSLFGIVGSR